MAGGAGRRLALLLAMAITIGCDRLTKHVAADTLAGTSGQSLLGGSVQLEYAENPGAFLGFGAGWPPPVRMTIFVTATVIGLFVMLRLARRLRHAPAARFGLALIAGGALSNLSDRLAYGSVVDFIHVGVGPVRSGIFNVADVAIMAGAALLIGAITSPVRPAPSAARPS